MNTQVKGPPNARPPWRVLARAFAVQGSWNYETLAGTGFAFVILPALRLTYPDPAELDAAVRRHEQPFNSHPYLATLALGAVIRMEEEGRDPEMIERFKAALRGSLGTLGDQLVWAGWRPVCVLCALGLLLAGAPWWGVVVGFLVFYNAVHVALMGWGLSLGYREGMGVAERLRSSLVRRTQPKMMAAGAFLTGLVAALLAARGIPRLSAQVGLEGPASEATPEAWLWAVLAVAAVAAGARWGQRARQVGVVGVAVLVVLGLVLGVT